MKFTVLARMLAAVAATQPKVSAYGNVIIPTPLVLLKDATETKVSSFLATLHLENPYQIFQATSKF